MSAPTTLATLKTEIEDYLARSDLTSKIENFISYAEAIMNTQLRCRSMIANVDINPSQVNKYVSLPTGFLELISFSYDLGEPLHEVDYNALEDFAYSAGATRPKYYAPGS